MIGDQTLNLSELGARESIRDIVARYNSYGDSGRIDAMMALFAPDARVEIVGGECCEGVDAIRAFFSGVARPDSGRRSPQRIQHHTATHQIDLVDAQSATGRCYFAVYTTDGLDHWGRYIDEYTLQDDTWQFRSRRVHVDGYIPGGWGAPSP